MYEILYALREACQALTLLPHTFGEGQCLLPCFLGLISEKFMQGGQLFAFVILFL
jgi:hypothetical protein